MLTHEGINIPDELLIGIIQTQWPIKIFYDDRTAAAEWLAEGSSEPGNRRRVYRVKLEPMEELTYIPPVPASLESKPLKVIG